MVLNSLGSTCTALPHGPNYVFSASNVNTLRLSLFGYVLCDAVQDCLIIIVLRKIQSLTFPELLKMIKDPSSMATKVDAYTSHTVSAGYSRADQRQGPAYRPII